MATPKQTLHHQLPQKSRKRDLLMVVLISLALKGVYLILAFTLSGSTVVSKNYETSIRGMHNVFMKQDAWWYKQIAEKGYREIRDAKQIGYSNKSEFIQSE
ncbi:MAG: hypothetical protein HKN32_02005, partial [Flavobacteriales bacterium]|nr:hypothetical protein [Flavobacteriales bacterium]